MGKDGISREIGGIRGTLTVASRRLLRSHRNRRAAPPS